MPVMSAPSSPRPIVIDRRRRTLRVLRSLLALVTLLTLVLGTPSHDGTLDSNTLIVVRVVAPGVTTKLATKMNQSSTVRSVQLAAAPVATANHSNSGTKIIHSTAAPRIRRITPFVIANLENARVAKNRSKRVTRVRLAVPVSTAKLAKRLAAQHHSSLLLYGVEISYLFPIDLYKRTASHKTFSIRAGKALQKLVQELKHAGVSAMLSTPSTKPVPGPADSWKLQQERHGFEVASPLAPSFEEIEVVLSIVQDFGCFVHPEFTAMHINIDAHDRPMVETRNVYKNVIAVEQALDLLRFTNQSARSGGEANGMATMFDSIQDAYESLDNTTSFQSLLGLGVPGTDTAGTLPRLRSRYKVGMRLERNGTVPRTFEFRGLEASLDPSVPISWLKLCMQLIHTSYNGNVVEPIERSTEEAWSVLFGELVRDNRLQDYFRHRRKIIEEAHQRPDVLEFNVDFVAHRRMRTR